MKYTFKVTGMSCSHCERAVNEAVKTLPGVSDVTASAPKGTVIVKGSGIVTKGVSAAITEAGYEVTGQEESSDEDGPRARQTAARAALIAVISGALIAIVMYTLSMGIVPEIPKEAGYGLLFITGLLTSFHCAAMCGGIALSVSSGGEAETGFAKVLPSALYNAGRIISYTLIGGLVGAIGSVFDFAPPVKSGIMIAAGIFMAVMGLKMLGLLSFIKIPLLALISKGKLSSFSSYGPLAAGILNGIMPCGPLQMMQLFAFGTGSAASGAASMFFFSLGTAPLMFGLGAAGTFAHRRFRMTLYKAGGILVIALGIMTIASGINFTGKTVLAKSSGAAVSALSMNVQKVESSVTANAYQPIVVQKGLPVSWTLHVPASQLNGCNNAIIIPDLNIQKRLVPGDNVITFTPSKSGTIGFTCWMGMISSSITVVDDISRTGKISSPAALSAQTSQGQGRCGGFMQGRPSCCSRPVQQ